MCRTTHKSHSKSIFTTDFLAISSEPGAWGPGPFTFCMPDSSLPGVSGDTRKKLEVCMWHPAPESAFWYFHLLAVSLRLGTLGSTKCYWLEAHALAYLLYQKKKKKEVGGQSDRIRRNFSLCSSVSISRMCVCVLEIPRGPNENETKKKKKITAQSIPMWSPTIVLTLPSTV